MNNYTKWYKSVEQLSKKIIHNLNIIHENLQTNKEIVVIFDIDNTLIDDKGNYIKPMKKVYNHTKKLNITPILVTNRLGTDYIINITKVQLEKNGFNNYKLIYFRTENSTNPYEYKKSARKDIYNNEMITIMSIGDKPWDYGEYGGIDVKVPTLNQL